MTSTTNVKGYTRRRPEAAQKQADRQHAMTAVLRRENELARALDRLNAISGNTDRREHRTPSQTETLSSIPPITAFMGMGG